MKKKFLAGLATGLFLVGMVGMANATLISVSGEDSILGSSANIIAAPSHALDDMVTNTGMQGFNEAQGVFTTVSHSIDGGVITAGTLVDSHMIFLNTEGGTYNSHQDISWIFDGIILGVMSDYNGSLEAASTFELGNPTTNYTSTFTGSGPAAPFSARGFEGNDTYTFSGNTLNVSMFVSEPGDWVRVVTAANPVPEPATMLLFGTGLAGLVGSRIRRKKK